MLGEAHELSLFCSLTLLSYSHRDTCRITSSFHQAKKRQYLPIRLLCAAVFSLVVITGLSYLNSFVLSGNNNYTTLGVLLSIFGYICLFSLSVLLCVFLLKGSIYELFSDFTKSFALRQIAFCLYIILIESINPELNFLDYRYGTWQNCLIYIAIYFLIYGTSFVLIFRKIFKLYENILDIPLLIFYIIVVLATIIINSISEFFSQEDKLFYILVMICELITLVLIFAFDAFVKRSNDLKVENYISAKMLKQQEWQYKYAKASSDELKIRVHDLKHQVRILREGGKDADELLKQLEDDIKIYDDLIVTDNQVLNIVLQEKWYYCKKHDIRLSTIVNPEAFKSVSNTYLYALIGNVLDNAIEAVLKIQDKEKRVISAEISYKNSLSIFRCDNYFQGEIPKEDEEFMTSKADKESHGLGIKSIKHIASYYQGNSQIIINNDIFTIIVTIPDSES